MRSETKSLVRVTATADRQVAFSIYQPFETFRQDAAFDQSVADKIIFVYGFHHTYRAAYYGQIVIKTGDDILQSIWRLVDGTIHYNGVAHLVNVGVTRVDEKATSLSVGDIITVDGIRYMIEGSGFTILGSV